LALEAVGAALSGGGAEHETVRPLQRSWGWQAHALLRRRPGVQPGHWRGIGSSGGGRPHSEGELEGRRERSVPE